MAGLVLRLGRYSTGGDALVDLGAAWHLALQGQTRSGKSVSTYVLLSQVARRRDVRVAGVDPTGILLNPWREHPGADMRSLGVSDTGAAAEALERVVSVMDERIAWLLSQDLDKIEVFSADMPLLVVVLEEYPGLLAAVSGDDQARKPADRVGPRITRAVRRLIQEGAKVGVRVLLIAQRFDASIIGGAERSNLGLRLTHRVDNSDAVGMLIPDPGPEVVEEARALKPGVGLVSLPGEPVALMKTDFMTYQQYVERVRGGDGRA